MSDRDRLGARAVYGAPPAPPRTTFVCAWCGVRTFEPITVTGTQHDGLFCSHRCIDRAEAATKCSIVGCEVCSGAMRGRKGGDSGG